MEEGRVIKVTGLTLEVNSEIYDGHNKEIRVFYTENGDPLFDCDQLLYNKIRGAEQQAFGDLAYKLHQINLADLNFCIQNTKETPK